MAEHLYHFYVHKCKKKTKKLRKENLDPTET